jgi:hypothetical protein
LRKRSGGNFGKNNIMMTTFKKILTIFFGIFATTFLIIGLIGILNHNSFQSVVINTLKVSGFCVILFIAGMFIILVTYKILNYYDITKSKKCGS